MIISTKKGTPKEELEKIVDRFEKQGLDVTLITGKDYNVFGLVGDTTKIDERDVLANPWIDNVTRVSAPYKRANRLFHPADSVIDCGGVKIGGKEKIAVMAGPCSIESEDRNHPREPSPETTPGHLPRIRPEPLRKHPRNPPPETILHPPPGTGLETIPATTNSRNHSRNHLRNHRSRNRPSDSGPPRPLRKPGHFPRSKAIRPGQGTLPGTNIDRE